MLLARSQLLSSAVTFATLAFACGGRTAFEDFDAFDPSAGGTADAGGGGRGGKSSGGAFGGKTAAGAGGQAAGGTGGASRGGAGGSGGTRAGGGATGLGGAPFGGSDVGGRPAVCGDGVLDLNEYCDDGNREAGDSCSADCGVGYCLVPVAYPTLQTALADESCALIVLQQGEYRGNVRISRSVRIEGAQANAVFLESAQNEGSIVTVLSGSVELVHLVVRNGNNEGLASGIVNTSDLTLYDVTVENNSTYGTATRGAGIYSSGALRLVNSIVANNQIQAVTSEALPTVDESAFGAGVFIESGGLFATGSVIRNNVLTSYSTSTERAGRARLAGAGIYARGDVVLNGSDVVENAEACDRVQQEEFECDAAGAGIHMDAGTLTLDGASISSNFIEARASYAFARGGGVYLDTETEFVARRSKVYGNVVNSAGLISGLAEGGGVYATELLSESLDFEEDSFDENIAIAAGRAGSVRGGGIYLNFDNSLSLSFRNSIVRNNRAIHADEAAGEAEGGGLFVDATAFAGFRLEFRNSAAHDNLARGSSASGGFFALNPASSVAADSYFVNSTLYRNASEGAARSVGGAIAVTAPAGGEVTLSFYNATLAYNAASAGGGFFITGGVGVATAYSQNSLFAFNVAQDGADCQSLNAEVHSRGFNLFRSLDSCPSTSAGTDLYDLNPLLGDFAQWGGITPTLPLGRGSTAVDVGNPQGCTDLDGRRLPVDQRGFRRLGRCDIGAFELQ